MTVKELVTMLKEHPHDMEVFMSVKGVVAVPTDIDWCVGGVSAWLEITDYKLTEQGAK